MPVQSATYLANKNAHPRDSRIRFEEKGHLYTVDGYDTGDTSVTTIVHKFFGAFDAPAMAAKVAGKDYPEGHKYHGKDAAELIAMWAANGREASELGSNLHQQAELYMDHDGDGGERTVPETPTREFQHFLNFWEDRVEGKMVPYRSEMYIFDEELRICGSMDALFKDARLENTYYIVDWKRVKNLSGYGFGRRARDPISHLPDCNLSQYSLQLNVYRTILEKSYGMVIGGMYLVVLHPDNDDYVVQEVSRMEYEIDLMTGRKKQDRVMPGQDASKLPFLFANLNACL